MATWNGKTLNVNCFRCGDSIKEDLSSFNIRFIGYLWCADCRGKDRAGGRPPKTKGQPLDFDTLVAAQKAAQKREDVKHDEVSE